MQCEAILYQGPKRAVKSRSLAFASAIFLSAFLLFQVELILSKCLLPWFGGSASVWTTSMLVFQTLLFAGYAYAHILSTRLRPAKQFWVHLLLITASATALAVTAVVWPSPITPSASWKPLDPEHPVVKVIGLLLVSVGLPFFALSSTGPLLQKWFTFERRKSPYHLYAISNLGSLYWGWSHIRCWLNRSFGFVRSPGVGRFCI